MTNLIEQWQPVAENLHNITRRGYPLIKSERELLAAISDLEAALKREDTLVAWLVRFLDIAEPAESMAHLGETEALTLLTEEIKQALEPYRAKEQGQ